MVCSGNLPKVKYLWYSWASEYILWDSGSKLWPGQDHDDHSWIRTSGSVHVRWLWIEGLDVEEMLSWRAWRHPGRLWGRRRDHEDFGWSKSMPMCPWILSKADFNRVDGKRNLFWVWSGVEVKDFFIFLISLLYTIAFSQNRDDAQTSIGHFVGHRIVLNLRDPKITRTWRATRGLKATKEKKKKKKTRHPIGPYPTGRTGPWVGS